MKNVILETAKKVLETEILGANSLKALLNQNLTEVVNVIAGCKGRVIISGVGKSGHIGKKISSTMASIGIKSFFLHPSEASHGDLGMIDKADVIIMISNSGETKEFSHLITFTKLENITSIAITRSEFSTLANACNYKIVLPNITEVVSYNAPTTSTTQTLIIGDIISVCASQVKGFSSADYAKIHPGGKLGLSLNKISSVMRKLEEITVFSEAEKVTNVISQMKSGIALILDKQYKLKGILTDGDIRRGIVKFGNILNAPLQDLTTKTPFTLNEDEPIIKAVEAFNQNQFGAIIILNNQGVVVGIVDRKDIEI